MADSETSDSIRVIRKWLNRAEGAVTPQARQGREVVCDYCMRTINPREDITSYLSNKLVYDDNELSPDFPPFHFLRAYCEECTRVEILDDCQGYNEILLISKLNQKRCLTDFDILDYSSSSEGIPYDPIELWEVGHNTVTFDKFVKTLNSMQQHNVSLGPADIADEYRINNINPHSIFNENGKIDISNNRRKEIQDKISKDNSQI